VFVAFGAGKFVNHASELASFKSYGLPAPGAFVVLIGLIELVGGALVIAGWLLGRRRWSWRATWSARSSCRGLRADRSSA
jgi:hypothetical protein